MLHESSDLNTSELFCQAALEPKLWSSALANLLPRFRSKHVSFHTRNETAGGENQLLQSGFSDAELKLRFSPKAMQNWENWRPQLPVGKFFTNQHIMDNRDWERSETYNDFIRDTGVYHGALFTQITPEMSFHFAICRPDANDPYADDELKALQLLVPHIASSLSLQQRLKIVGQQTSVLRAALDGIAEGAILVNAKGMPLLVNARAQTLLDRGDILMNRATGLQTHLPPLTQSLLEAIRTVSDPRWMGDLRMSLPRKKPLLPLLLEIVSLARLGEDLHGAGRASAMIFIREPDAPVNINQEALADALHLTKREVDVAVLLAGGLGTEIIAAKIGVTVGTVRFHIKRVFQKTGTRNQAALVSLLHGFGSR